MAKAEIKKEVESDMKTESAPKKQEKSLPKIHLTKYANLHSLTKMEFAFVNAKFGAKMYTEKEWEKLISRELSRSLR